MPEYSEIEYKIGTMLSLLFVIVNYVFIIEYY